MVGANATYTSHVRAVRCWVTAVVCSLGSAGIGAALGIEALRLAER